MSRLQLYEASKSNLDVFETIVNTIWKDCKPFITDMIKNVYIGEFLYSGRKDARTHFTKSVRTDRRPKDTFPDIHRDFDDRFQKKFGWPARSAGLFCTGSKTDADSYGESYMVFPIGKYKFLWSDDVPDLYLLMARKLDSDSRPYVQNPLLNQFINDIRKNAGNIDDSFDEYYYETVKEGGDHGYYVYESIDEVIEIPSKIKDRKKATEYVKSHMDNPEKFTSNNLAWYPELDQHDFYERFFNKWVDERHKSFEIDAQTMYDEWFDEIIDTYSSKDLEAAIQSENEVMVSCKKWFGVRASLYVWDMEKYMRKFGVKGHGSREELEEWWRSK